MGTGTGMEKQVALAPYDIVERRCDNCHFYRDDRVVDLPESSEEETDAAHPSTKIVPQCTESPQALVVPIQVDDYCSRFSISEEAFKRAERKIKDLKVTLRV